MSQPAIDLTSELLRGMRLSGVNYRRIETARPFGVGFSAVAGKAQFHFISRGPGAAAHGQRGTVQPYESGDALFIPRDGTPCSQIRRPRWSTVAQLPSETVCSTVSCINAGDQPDCPERAVIFSGCMDFELGGMQPLVKAMPEVMRVSSLLNTWPEIQPLLVAMERESLTRQAGYAGILARLADVVAALIVRGWVACGCGNATGWVQVLRDPRLAKAIYAMHQRPGSTGKWKIWRGRRVFHARCSRNVFSPPPAPPPPAISQSCVCGWRCSTSPMKARRWKKSPSASGISRWPPSAGLSNASPASRRGPCAPRHARVSLYVKRYTPSPTTKAPAP